MPGKYPDKIKSLPLYDGRFDAYKLEAKGSDVLFASYPAGTIIPPHTHNTDNHGVITRGELKLKLNGEVTKICAGEWYHVPANVKHSAEFEVDTDEIEFWFMSSLIKSKTKRLLVGFFLPILLGSIGLCSTIFTDSRITLSSEFNEWFKQVIIEAFIPVLTYAVALGGIQTIIYSFLMEKLINPKIKSHLLVIIISAILGVMSTLLSSVVTQHYMLYSIIGGVTGIIVGAILRKMYINAKRLHYML